MTSPSAKNFVVGDIQGCYKGLRSLLKEAGFKSQRDKLWSVGDLVARGPSSLETLQFLHDLGEHFDTVLGNHDLHLIAMAHGIGSPKPVDKLEALMNHKSFDSLIEWLMQKPLAAKPAKHHLISHAGLYPTWSLKKAINLSQEVEAQLQSKKAKDLLNTMYGNTPTVWSEELCGEERLRFVVNAFTRMRYLNGLALEFKTKCHPNSSPENLSPWFDVANQKLKPNKTLIFGHWASLMGRTMNKRVIGLDTGFVWGKQMTLYCIENKQFFSVQA